MQWFTDEGIIYTRIMTCTLHVTSYNGQVQFLNWDTSLF